MYQVTLLFPSFQAFRLWCKAMDISYNQHDSRALYRNGEPLGRYQPAPDSIAGILAEIAIQPHTDEAVT